VPNDDHSANETDASPQDSPASPARPDDGDREARERRRRRQAARRRAVEELAAAVRRLADVAVETDVEPDEVEAVTRELDALAARLGVQLDTRGYSGLVGPAVDYSIPEAPMPLNPIIGACSPVRPDVRMWFEDGEVHGTATMSKRFVGPPGFAHGGISAMLVDQLTAVSPGAMGVKGITKTLHVRFRRPLPLDEPLELVGRCERDGDALTATCEVRARGEVAVEGRAELITFEALAQTRTFQEGDPGAL
jgi:acyl-coenzyme A thioesterase PaaI-like protein